MGKIGMVISGGQTGVDRAALDAAMELDLPAGGWCPRGRLAEDGTIPARYPLREAHSPDYDLRTRWNVRDSHGTLILCRGEPVGGTLFTAQIARSLERPTLILNPGNEREAERFAAWFSTLPLEPVLNVAGPRESTEPGIGATAHEFLKRVFSRCV